MSFEQETVCFPKTVQVTKEDFLSSKKLKQSAKSRLSTLVTEFPAFARAVASFVNTHPER